MTFLGTGSDGQFRGVITDPIPVEVDAQGYVRVRDEDFEAPVPTTS